jgi:SAM-dependent methyltransferase
MSSVKFQRHSVFRSGRLRATERLLARIPAQNVVEVGAGDYSFSAAGPATVVRWLRADLQEPCDVVCDFNSDEIFLPFREARFDLAICTEVLEHLLWPHFLLKEIHRVLAPGGHLIVSVPNMASLSYRFAWLMGHLPSCAASGNLPQAMGSTSYEIEGGRTRGGHVVDFTMQRLHRLLETAGFAILEAKGSGIIWHRQVLPHWMVPPSLASNVIFLARKPI